MPKQKLKILATGDAKSAFRSHTPYEILSVFGSPRTLLTSSTKAKKCEQVGVFSKVLYLTPGIFCPAATKGCLRGCLGHTSGRMQLPTSTLARDRRAALYLHCPDVFLRRLKAELVLFETEAHDLNLKPAVRLNGTSDLPWERLHPDVFSDFPRIQFFDYTKIPSRMKRFLDLDREWPSNYHLTYSLDERNETMARSFLSQKGNVAIVFSPEIPVSWFDAPVIDGDKHDARFLDAIGRIVGLRTKGVACVDLHGFVKRPCPRCKDGHTECLLDSLEECARRTTLHRCPVCDYRFSSSYRLPCCKAAA